VSFLKPADPPISGTTAWMASMESSFTGAHCNVAANEVHLHVVLVPRKKASCLEGTATGWLQTAMISLLSA